MPRRPPSDDEFARAAADLVRRLRGWTRASWAVGSRAAAVYRGIQRLADLAAATEGRSTRPVPRLADSVLPDQLAVMAHDVARTADPAAARAALAELAALRAALS
jgi:hypothetical protein